MGHAFERRVNTKLFEQVMEQIESNPEHFEMQSFFAADTYKLCSREAVMKDLISESRCGTTACIAGWAITLHHKNNLLSDGFAICGPTEDAATGILGINYDEAQRLFYVENWPDPYRREYIDAEQPEERVRISVDRINYFLATKGQ